MLQKVLPLLFITIHQQAEQYTAGQYAMHVFQSRLGRIVRKDPQYAGDAQRMLELLKAICGRHQVNAFRVGRLL